MKNYEILNASLSTDILGTTIQGNHLMLQQKTNDIIADLKAGIRPIMLSKKYDCSNAYITKVKNAYCPEVPKLKSVGFIDRTGLKVGMLKFIRFVRFSQKVGGHSVWLMECDCGNTKEMNGTSVVFRYIKSCGCLAKGKSL